MVKNSLANAEDASSIPGWEDLLEKEMAIHSSILAWRIPWTEELGRLQSTGRKEWDTTERLHLHSTVPFLEIKMANNLNFTNT